MPLILTPQTLRDDATGTIVIERRFESEGVTFELSTFERLSPHIVFSDPWHFLSLALTRVPKEWWWSFPPDGRHVAVGSLTFLPAGTQVRVATRAGRHRWLNMKISPALFEKLLGGRAVALTPIAAIGDTPMDTALYRIAREMSSPTQGTASVIDALKESVLIDLARLITGPQRPRGGTRAGLSKPQLATLTSYIENAEYFAPTIADIAVLLGISRRHLTRLFRLSTGQTIHTFLSEVRLRKAMRLLATTQLSVKEIAHKVGFSTTGGLTATFRTATGQTPTKYRQSHRAP